MFSHLTLLNHHKRIHTQDGTDTTNDQQITVVTQQAGQNLVQGNNLVNDNGQNLAQIQIVATEAMDQQVQGGDHQQQANKTQRLSNHYWQPRLLRFVILEGDGVPPSRLTGYQLSHLPKVQTSTILSNKHHNK